MTAPKRKICAVTGTRAEYGLLYWTLRRLAADPRAQLQLVVTGAHLSPVFGMTVDMIEADGFTVDARVDMLLAADTPVAIAKSLALAGIGITEAFERLEPDLVVLLGDRYEILPAAQGAMLLGLPVAHIHGGEVTEGAIDDAIRHAVTKMSHLHFATTQDHADRIVQMGENAAKVWNVGSPGVEVIRKLTPLSRAEVEARLGMALRPTNLLVTYHPVTVGVADPAAGMRELVTALSRFPDASVVITGVNADPGNRAIASVVEQFAAAHPGRVAARPSLGSLLYLSTMYQSSVVVGNSSSGIIEAPSVGVPTVNMGARQDGRPRAASVIDCDETADAVASALAQALDPTFRDGMRTMVSPYDGGDASERISQVLLTHPLDGLQKKRFHDLLITRA
ncbi:putative UDP-N-acetylglucosamine 2-epimerase [Magnetospirillum gryphiswaldense MSR-1 v2]|uniref:UDP-N-acetylglucosamine 2-epimerase n=1 Tax=Magnetospirillum gryphiswaldense (strain DSM 6361 / JCM 21280 / NBRC 15271 / MSR-1) TaxID=431944 RepID=V6F809_MAGGM|nr:UDP-N-acetylglucosamine 2-epimerase [Magnetospirillum gryphiswaldense]CDL00623.1 putative UDP-N-acetylglucosamine 2-epimerase [Magnetospirillum gryphiswaldense MSR-1 v2]